MTHACRPPLPARGPPPAGAGCPGALPRPDSAGERVVVRGRESHNDQINCPIGKAVGTIAISAVVGVIAQRPAERGILGWQQEGRHRGELPREEHEAEEHDAEEKHVNVLSVAQEGGASWHGRHAFPPPRTCGGCETRSRSLRSTKLDVLLCQIHARQSPTPRPGLARTGTHQPNRRRCPTLRANPAPA